MLDIRSLRKSFFVGTPNERVALDGLTLTLESGAFCIVIGSNGAGKSTLFNAIAGKFRVDSGRILLDGDDVSRQPLHVRARCIARVFQDPLAGTAPGMTIEENLLLAELRPVRRRLRWGLTRARRANYREHLARLGLGLENRLGDEIGTLSGGQRQAVSLVMAILRKPRLLLLDEHTAALDPLTAGVVMRATVEAVDDEKLTTLLVTHNMQLALDHGSQLIMLDRGRIIRSLTAAAKSRMSITDLVATFRESDDRPLLTR
jgi:putative tryptophan/tyrosine transport system ATP-binding protein